MGKQCCYYRGNVRFTSPNLPRLCSFVLAVNVDGGQVDLLEVRWVRWGEAECVVMQQGNNLGTWVKF